MLDTIKQWFVKRKIVSVESWDGSASNYSTPKAYADASLMNFNTGNPDEWVKELIKLPVRREGDAKDVYVKEAVYAASGGRGITQVTKPENVSEDEFNRQLKSAANELIKAYKEMDQLAPDSVYEIAGKEKPMERQAKSLSEIYYDICEMIYLMDMAEDTYTHIVDFYIDDESKEMFVIVAQNGRLYKIPVGVFGGNVALGVDKYELDLNPERQQRSLTIFRQANGHYRWLSIAGTTALNRSGEIDSKELFDSFIEHINKTGEYPILNFYHQGDNSRLGIADYVARDENVYIASGIFDDNEFGRAAAKGIENKPDYWGNSIEFMAYEGDVARFVTNDNVKISIPVYTRGINTAISILPESVAAAWGTTHMSTNGGLIMNKVTKDALTELLGDPELVENFEDVVDGVNQEINERMIHRSTEETVEEEVEDSTVENETVEDETVEEDETEQEIVLDENFVNDLLPDLVDNETFQSYVEERAREVARGMLAGLESRIATLENRLSETENQLQESEYEQRARWEEDSPQVKRAKRVSYRGRSQTVFTEENQRTNNDNFAARAENTLQKIKGEGN